MDVLRRDSKLLKCALTHFVPPQVGPQFITHDYQNKVNVKQVDFLKCTLTLEIYWCSPRLTLLAGGSRGDYVHPNFITTYVQNKCYK